ncbi:hypothetical protein [Candidatus Manganitrophus noduliformans]|uniref:Uncharacterized protein n=1 Tax=Candidatus Manganitrophus noduliformans TaxID=2606439 RepID=A0A7X6IBP8_9BACT|nr:hypothetical protein [Candidatus Manganitrophus noduliformans]NKE71858.1 hypothetical protein [Candidatus Manganitrophus noduliformans]
MNKYLVSAIAFVFLMMGIAIGSAISYWNLINSSFFQVRMLEIVQLTVTVSIAVFVTYFINSKINHEIKKKEMLNDLISRFQNHLTDVVDLGYDYMENPNKEKERSIIRKFKNLGVLLSIIKDIKTSEDESLKYDETLYLDYIKLKGSITDTPFGQKGPKYSEEAKRKVEDHYCSLLNRLYECKLKLYSN